LIDISLSGWHVLGLYVQRYHDWINQHTNSCTTDVTIPQTAGEGGGECSHTWFGAVPWSGGVRGVASGLMEETQKYKMNAKYLCKLARYVCLRTYKLCRKKKRDRESMFFQLLFFHCFFSIIIHPIYTYRIARHILVLVYDIPLLYIVGVFTLLCLVFGSWTTLRLPILGGVLMTLAFEFWFYWIVSYFYMLLQRMVKKKE
jgi:hypothetical protein